jgi:hypothetical protein
MKYGNNEKLTLQNYVMNQLLTAKNNIEVVKFRMTGIDTFYGKVDLGSLSQTNKKIPGYISLECEDNTYLLDEEMDTSFEYPDNDDLTDEGWAVFDPDNPAESIIHLRLFDAGYTLTDIDEDASDTISTVIKRIVYDSDDGRTYRDLLDTLLMECGAVLDTTDEGKIYIKNLKQTTVVADRVVEKFLNSDGIKTKGGDWQNDGYEITWSSLAVKTGATVYNASLSDERDDYGDLIGEEIASGAYWPESGNEEDVYQEFEATFLDSEYYTGTTALQNDDLSLISVKNGQFNVIKDSDIIIANNPPDIYPLKGRILFYNKNTVDSAYLKALDFEGDALYRYKLNKDTFPTTATNPKEYTTEFVYSYALAEELANYLHKFNTYGDLSHTWAEDNITTPMFQIVQLSPVNTAISTLAMVVSTKKTYPAPNVVRRTNTAIGVTAFNSEPTKRRSKLKGATPTNTGEAGTNGTVSVVQYALGTETAPYESNSVVGDDYDTVGDDYATLGIDSVWSYTAPTPGDGEYLWKREGTYTPPATFSSSFVETRVTADPVRSITLKSSTLTIPTTSRGVPKISIVTLTALLQNLTVPDDGLTWTCSQGTLALTTVSDYSVSFVPDSDTNDSLIIEVSMTYNSVTYSSQVSIVKVADGTPAALYFGKVTTVPTETTEHEPLVTGDFIFYAGESITDSYQYGHIYKYDKDTDTWSSSVGSYELGVAAKDAFAEARASGNYVYAAVVYAQNVYAMNMQAGAGTGLANSGFRFRAMSDSVGDGTDVPVFDVYKDDKMLFKVDIEESKIYFGENFWYDPDDGAIHTPNDRFIINSNGQLEGDAIQFLTSPNASNSQPWELAHFTNTDAYILDFINDTPSEMATKLDNLFTTYDSYKRDSFSADADMVTDTRNGVIMFYSVSGNNSTMQLYNSALGIVDISMAHYIERYATSTGFRYEIGTVTNIGGLAPLKLLYNTFLMYITSSDTWEFPTDPFRDFTTVRILGISYKTDLFGDLNVFDGDFSVDGKITGATVNTGNGDCEVYKNSYVDYGAERNTSATMDSMTVGELRFIRIGFAETSNKYLIAPSGGTYFVVNGTGIISGGSSIVTSNENNVTNYNLLVRRIS